MEKKRLKELFVKEALIIIVFVLIGIVGHKLFPYLYAYYVRHFPSESNAPYSEALIGWWSVIGFGYVLSLFVRYTEKH